MEQLPYLVDDLVALENGIVLFDALYMEKVFVFAPLLFIKADNSRHADVIYMKASAAAYPSVEIGSIELVRLPFR
ncbi:hypothetical protein BD770DRAFT_449937 [Pilaira anomala]|nr:hypothetical protein BD770DRAFT_449937 [Pilaira anomala]